MSNYPDTIKKDFKDLDKLIETPKTVQNLASDALNKVLSDSTNLKHTDKTVLNNARDTIKNISDENLQNSFNIIYNQLCVLGVSALSATLEKYFLDYCRSNVSKINVDSDRNKSLRVKLSDLKQYSFNVSQNLGEIILEKDSKINFQDLQSIKRTFEIYLNKEIHLSKGEEGKIIFYTQCRHNIVHNNGEVSEQFLKKVENTNYDNVFNEGDSINLGEKDWKTLKKAFISLVEKATT